MKVISLEVLAHAPPLLLWRILVDAYKEAVDN
jgi:hypothetical protein